MVPPGHGVLTIPGTSWGIRRRARVIYSASRARAGRGSPDCFEFCRDEQGAGAGTGLFLLDIGPDIMFSPKPDFASDIRLLLQIQKRFNEHIRHAQIALKVTILDCIFVLEGG